VPGGAAIRGAAVIFGSAHEVDYCQFEHLAACSTVRHAIFLRTRGGSDAPFDRLNVGLSVGDEVERVAANRRRVADALGASELVFVRQVHGLGVRIVDDRPAAADAAPSEADILITDRAGKFLAVQVADCQPILMYDPVRRVVANVHCGWRGSVADVAGRAVEALRGGFGCAAKDLLVGVGPSLGPCCAEFVNYREEIPAGLWCYRRDTVCFDFWAMTRDQLMAAGVRDEHIEISRLCTRCNPDRFFSYRGAKRTGRFVAVIGLRL
jgi:polyphenol oxidase